ncbi:MAG TPA: formylmethanofuran--tetrahydromethanopterin N-formyltransferase [Methylococcaceae bacterium]|nr:formylmethanofuran--tetrahydromethanopterin N-formyltransferase [Methylococcaceae bacterium]
MFIQSTEIVDTFAEAFKMWGTRVVITAASRKWAQAAGRSMTGFATSVIGCKCEAGIERELSPEETPDGRPGVSVLLFGFSADGVGKRLLERIGQCVLTCPTTACYNGLEAEQKVVVGGKLRYFGDSYQIGKLLGGRRLWRVPVMEGEFFIEDSFGVQPAVGGGNFLVLGRDLQVTLDAVEAAVEAMQVPGAIMPFPDGVVRSGSKPGSRYKALPASTNDAYCPTLRGVAPRSELPEGVNCVLEIVIDGLDEDAVKEAMRLGVRAAVREGIVQITAGNYGGNLGQYHIGLHDILGS